MNMINNGNTISISKDISKTLEWPSPAISLFRTLNQKPDQKQILVGTNTADQEPNYITQIICDTTENDIKIKRKFKHPSNVIKLLSLDTSHCISASSNNNIYLYNLEQNNPEVSTKPDVMLTGVDSLCTGLSLGLDPSLLLSSSEDGKVVLWNLNTNYTFGEIRPEKITTYHKGKVNDVAWNRGNKYLFASCGEDKNLIFYDIREEAKVVNITTSSGVKKIDFNKINQNLFLSANADNIVDLWDLRNTKIKLHTFKYHTSNITQIRWSVNDEYVFCSSGMDKKLVIWDINNLKSTVYRHAQDIPYEASLVHQANSKILDFDWDDNFIVLTDTMNEIECIKMRNRI